MKCLKPPFSAMIGSQVMRWIDGCTELPSKSSDAHCVSVDDRDLAVAEKEDVARVLQNRWNVRSDEKLAIAETDHDRRPLAHGDDRVRFVGVDDREGEDAAQLSDGGAHSLFERDVLFEVFLDQVGHDLGVGFGDEVVIALAQSLFELKIVFDDAVVNDDDAAGAVAMRMRVLFGRTAVCGPTRVADAVSAVEWTQPDRLLRDCAVFLPRDGSRVRGPSLTTAMPAES